MVPGKRSRQGTYADFFVDSQDRLAEAEGDGRQELEEFVQGLLFRKASVGEMRNRSNLVSCIVMSTIPKRKYKRSDIEANYRNETKTV